MDEGRPIPDTDAGEEQRAVGTEAENSALTEEKQQQFVAALETLPLLTRAVFMLKRRDNLSYAEIGWRCGIAEDEVMNRMVDALCGLRRAKDGRTSLAGLMRSALLPCRDAWAAARRREGDRSLAPWTSPEHRPPPRSVLDWIAWAYELVFR